MSDEGLPFFGNPKAFEEAVDKQIMAQDEFTHAYFRRLSELDEEYLLLVRNTIAIALNDKNTIRVVLGHVSTLLDIKYGYCVACGSNHDREAEVLTKQYPQDPAADPPGRSPFHIGDAEAMRDMLLEKYGLYEDPEDKSGAVYCKKCGTRSISLEDRMMKSPGVDGCDTCQQQAKWG